MEFVLCAFGPSSMTPVTLPGPVLVPAMAASQVPYWLLSTSIFLPLFEPVWTGRVIDFRNYPGKGNRIPSK